MNSAQTIYAEALSLSDVDRAALAHDLISSLSGEALKSVSQEEIEKRIALIHSGDAISRPAHDVFHDIRRKL
ncbi:MAG: addiction module protein [Pontiellaceae bacterium]|nr:addiction module protein [Pontiellaceae bacterium]